MRRKIFVISILLFFLLFSSMANAAQEDLSLSPGWNLVSFNVQPNVQSPQELLGGVEGLGKIFAYKEGAWYSWNFSRERGDLESVQGKIGYWISNETDANVNILVQGASGVSLDMNTLDFGWNLIGLGGLDNITAVKDRLATAGKTPLKAFVYSDGAWLSYNFGRERGDLEGVASNAGVWLQVASRLATQSLGTDYNVSVYADGIDADAEKTTISGTLNGQSFQIPNVSAADAYTIEVHDNYGNLLDSQTVSAGSEYLAENLTPGGGTEQDGELYFAKVRLYPYAMYSLRGAPSNVQDVDVFNADTGELIGKIKSTSEGINVPSGVTVKLVKDGFVPIDVEIATNYAVKYVTLQKKDDTESLIAGSQPTRRRTARSLMAPATGTIPMFEQVRRNSKGAVLSYQNLPANLGGNYNFSVTPIASNDTIPNRTDLESKLEETASENGKEFAVIGGGVIGVVERDGNDIRDVEDRSAGAMGLTGMIVIPYISTLYNDYDIELIKNEMDNLGPESDNESDNSVSLELWAYDGSEWVKMRDAGVYEQTNKDYVVPKAAGVLSGDLVVAPSSKISEGEGALITSDGTGGMYDYVYVKFSDIQATIPTVVDIYVKVVVEDEPDTPLTNALVKLQSGEELITNENGIAFFDDFTIPMDADAIVISALRNDHYQSSITLERDKVGNTEENPHVIALKPVSDTGQVVGQVVNCETYEGVEGAEVTLFTPNTLSELRIDAHPADGEEAIAAGVDSRATYKWSIKVHPTADGVVARSADNRLARVTGGDEWQLIKAGTGEDGAYLRYSEIVDKLISGEMDPGNSYLIGVFAVKLDVFHDIDQNGSPDVHEKFEDIRVRVDLNEELFGDFGTIAGEHVLNRLYYPNPGNVDPAYLDEQSVLTFSARGNRNFGYFFINPKAAGSILAYNLRTIWELDIRWQDDPNSPTKFKKLRRIDGNLTWDDVELDEYEAPVWGTDAALQMYEDDKIVEILNSVDPSGEGTMPILAWVDLLNRMSQNDIIISLTDFTGEVDNSDRYVESGVTFYLRGVVYADEPEGQSVDFNRNEVLEERNVPFVVPYEATIELKDLENNWRKLVSVTTADFAPPSTSPRILKTITDEGGYYKFVDIPFGLGGCDNPEMTTSYLRVRANKNGYVRSAMQTVPIFCQDNPFTEQFEDVAQKDIEICPEDSREVVVAVSLDSGEPVPGAMVTFNSEVVATDETGEPKLTEADGLLTVRVSTGSYTISALPPLEGLGSNADAASATVTVQRGEEPLEVAIVLTVSPWSSDLPPMFKNLAVSEVTEDGKVVVEGYVLEVHPDTGVEVPYGWSDAGERIRDDVQIHVNDASRKVALDDANSHFRTTVTSLIEGENLLQLTATNGAGTTESAVYEIIFTHTQSAVAGSVLAPADHPIDDWSNVIVTAMLADGGIIETVANVDLENNGKGKYEFIGINAGTEIRISAFLEDETGAYASDVITLAVNEGRTVGPDLLLKLQEETYDSAPNIYFEGVKLGDAPYGGNWWIEDIAVESNVAAVSVSGRVDLFDGDQISLLVNDQVFTQVDVQEGGLWEAQLQTDTFETGFNYIDVSAVNANGMEDFAFGPVFNKKPATGLGDLSVTISTAGEAESFDVAWVELWQGADDGTWSFVSEREVYDEVGEDDEGAGEETLDPPFEGLEEGQYGVTVYAANFQMAEQTVDVVAGPDNSVTILLLKGFLEGENVQFAEFDAKRVVNEQDVETNVANVRGKLEWKIPQADYEYYPEGWRFTGRLFVSNNERDQEAVLPDLTKADFSAGEGDNAGFYVASVDFYEAVELYAGDNYIKARLETPNGGIYSREVNIALGTSEEQTCLVQIMTYADSNTVVGGAKIVLALPDSPAFNLENDFAVMRYAGGENAIVEYNHNDSNQLIIGLASASDIVIGALDRELIAFKVPMSIAQNLALLDSSEFADTLGNDVSESIGIWHEVDCDGSSANPALIATLSWASGADVDLHSVYFPNWKEVRAPKTDELNDRVHIYWRQMEGAYGDNSDWQIQDLDWVKGGYFQNSDFWPEHHTWLDEDGRLRNGTYVFSVFNYGGMYPYDLHDDVENNNWFDGGKCADIQLTIEGPNLFRYESGAFSTDAQGAGLGNEYGQVLAIITIKDNTVANLIKIPVGDQLPAEYQGAYQYLQLDEMRRRSGQPLKMSSSR